MNPQSSTNRHNSGITLLEVMLVMAVIAGIGAFVFLPYLIRGGPHVSSDRIHCINNLKMIGLSHRLWAIDHGDRYPMAVPTSQGGTLGHAAFAQAWPHVTVLSNELNIPRILWCSSDDERVEAEVFDGTVKERNLSYFVGIDGREEKPWMILGGDRNLTMDGKSLKPGLHGIATNAIMGFTENLHDREGNVLLSDGSVQQVSEEALQQVLLAQGASNRFAIP